MPTRTNIIIQHTVALEVARLTSRKSNSTVAVIPLRLACVTCAQRWEPPIKSLTQLHKFNEPLIQIAIVISFIALTILGPLPIGS